MQLKIFVLAKSALFNQQKVTLWVQGLEALLVFVLISDELQADVPAVDNGMSISFFNIAKIVGLLVLLLDNHIIAVFVAIFLSVKSQFCDLDLKIERNILLQVINV